MPLLMKTQKGKGAERAEFVSLVELCDLSAHGVQSNSLRHRQRLSFAISNRTNSILENVGIAGHDIKFRLIDARGG